VSERVTVIEHLRRELVDGVDVGELLDARVDGNAEVLEPRERLVMRSQAWAALLDTELVSEEVEVARRGDPGVLLPQAPGGRVAGVREEPVAALALPAVQ